MKRRTLRVPDEGCCAFHPCDECERCQAGDCCGADVGEAGLPLEGSWPHQSFGTVGVLQSRPDGRLRCACCGEWFANLGRHVGAHNLSGDAYKAMWGLNCSTALASADLRALRAANGRASGHGFLLSENWTPATREQRSQWARNREARAQRRLALGQRPRATNGKWVAPTPGRFVAKQTPVAR